MKDFRVTLVFLPNQCVHCFVRNLGVGKVLILHLLGISLFVRFACEKSFSFHVLLYDHVTHILEYLHQLVVLLYRSRSIHKWNPLWWTLLVYYCSGVHWVWRPPDELHLAATCTYLLRCYFISIARVAFFVTFVLFLFYYVLESEQFSTLQFLLLF